MKNHSPRLLCSFQRRIKPYSGRCSTTGRLTCDTNSLVRQLKACAKYPMTADKLELYPAWSLQETSTAASMCAQPKTAACFLLSLHPSNKNPWSRRVLHSASTVIKLQCFLSVPQHTWPTFSTPVLTTQHRKVRKLQQEGSEELVG